MVGLCVGLITKAWGNRTRLQTPWCSITCAGIAGEARFLEYPAEEVRKIVNVNVSLTLWLFP